jgi:hypothetical protein
MGEKIYLQPKYNLFTTIENRSVTKHLSFQRVLDFKALSFCVSNAKRFS